MNACASPRLPSWACATSPTMRQRPAPGFAPAFTPSFTTDAKSDKVCKLLFHPPEVQRAAYQKRGRHHRRHDEHSAGSRMGAEQRPPEPFDHADHRIERVDGAESILEQTARIGD